MSGAEKLISIIIPARNEAAQIGGTVAAALAAVAHFEGCELQSLQLGQSRCEVLVVDNLSNDGTVAALREFEAEQGVRVLSCPRLKAPCARNWGAAEAKGKIYVFLDADTHIPVSGLSRIHELQFEHGYGAGIFALASQEPGLRAWIWWQFWNHVRLLPLARAKAMPAFMFCTRKVFEAYGPFDEDVVIGEEWPILAGLYQQEPGRLVYDRTIAAHSSSRRMELQPFGYTRTYLKYLWAILHHSGRVYYPDTIRQKSEEQA